jgi:hypothetical protein
MARYQIANSFFISMTSMQLDQPTSSASTFWYPALVRSYKVSHKMLRNPNRPCTNLRWTNHPHITSVNLVIPKLMKLIMDKVGLRSITIRTILAQVTLFTTSVANAAFGTLSLESICMSYIGLHEGFLLEGWVFFSSLRWFFIVLARPSLTALGGGQTAPGQYCWLVCNPQLSDPSLCIYRTISFSLIFFLSWRLFL